MKSLQDIIHYSKSSLNIWLMLLALTCLLPSCDFLVSKNDSYNNGFRAGYLEGLKDGKEQCKTASGTTDKTVSDPNYSPAPAATETRISKTSNPSVPEKAILVLDFIRKHKKAPEGYVGGRHFGNYEHNLPERDAAGNQIDYQEWDIQPKVEGKNRGAQRLVTGSDGRAWYTPDHYSTFIEISR